MHLQLEKHIYIYTYTHIHIYKYICPCLFKLSTPTKLSNDKRTLFCGSSKCFFCGTSLVAQMVKRLSTMQETRVWALGWEDPLEKEMAIHSSTIAWKIPWTEEPGRLESMGSQRVKHSWATSLHTRRTAGLPGDSERGDWKSLKLNIQKSKIVAFGPITSGQIDGETVETVLFL